MQAPTALTIAGSDAGGGAGVAADLKAFAAVGVHGASALTCVTAQNTRGVERIDPLPAEAVGAQLDAVVRDLDVGAVKTGLLHAPDVVRVVAERLERVEAPLVVDPVLVATSGDALAVDGLAGALDDLAPFASLVTPNTDELAALTRRTVTSLDEAAEAARALVERGWPAVLAKGGHLPGDEAVDLLVTADETRRLAYGRLAGPFHGAGCTYASLVAGLLARGHDVEDAVVESRARMHRALVRAVAVGAGPRVPDALEATTAWIPRDSGPAAGRLSAAAWRLAATLPARLVPEVGINLAYAPGPAGSADDVFGLARRITRGAGGPSAPGPVVRGGSGHVARVLLAARHVDPALTCAVNLAFAPAHLDAAREAGLSVASFDRDEEPPGAGSSMEWGTTAALKQAGGAVDLVWDEGGMGKEAMMRLVARDVDELVAKLARLVDAMA